MKHLQLTVILGLFLIFAGNVSAETITLNDDENTPSWGEQITVQEGTTLSPIYWGEGFSIEEITDKVQILDYQTQESIEIKELSSDTLYQDYVVNVCDIGEVSAEVRITRSTEDVESLCDNSGEGHSYGESISVGESDEIVFGPGKANSLEVESIREDTSNEDSSFFEFTTGQGLEKRIVYVESRESGRVEDVEFETGKATVFVEELSIRDKEAVIRIERDLSQSSNFECSQTNLEENQYAFCSQEGDTAVQNIDLGHTTVELEYRYNNRAYGSGEGVAATFTDSNGMTLTVTQRGLNYKQADIDIVEWRGLRQEHGGARQQAIIEVEPVRSPKASVDVNRNSLNPGESFNTVFEAFSSGRYRLEVEGAGLSRETVFDESENSRMLDFTPEERGEVRLNLVAPGNWWNPLNSDRVIDEETVRVEESEDAGREEYSFGEKFRLTEGESTTIEGRNFYLSALGPGVALWRPDRSSDTNSGINLLDDPTRMEFRYSDGFNGYGYLCDVSRGEASVVIESEEKNPWNVCDRNPSELRTDSSNYEFNQYELGEKTTVSPGEGLEFGESRLYIEEVSKSGDRWKVEGYKEWRSETTDYSAGPINYSSTDYFYEGDMASGLCDASEGEADIVIEEVDNIDSNWPQSHCTDDSSDSGDIKLTQSPSTPSWGDILNASSGETISPVYWGEGFEVLSTSSDMLEVRDLRTEEVVSIEPGEASTLYQDYVLHHCRTIAGSSSMIVTRGSDDTSEICPEEDRGDDSSEEKSDVEVNELQSTPSWGDNLNVSEGTTVSPVYWGEGFTVESISDGRIVIADISGERDVSIGEGNMRTFYQDYVIHACNVGDGEGTLSITTGRESHDGACGESSNQNSIEASIGTEGNKLEITGSMEVPSPCYGAEASELDVQGENIEVLVEPVEDEAGRVCPSVVDEASIEIREELEPGDYNVNVVIQERGGEREELSEEISVSGDSVDINVDFSPQSPELTDEVVLSAGPEGYRYEWDIDSDGEFEREGSQITANYEEPGSKSVTVRTVDTVGSNEETVKFEVSNPDIDSSLTVSKDEISLAEPLMIKYNVGEAVSRNGYTVEVENPDGDTLMEKSETSRSGDERFIPGNDAVTGTYRAKLVANEGFLSSIFRSIFGPEAEASFKVIDESESISEWRSYCGDNGYDHETASGRVSCIQEDIGPECFTENPSSECREIAESVCQYYIGTSFDASNGRCN